MGDYHRVGSLRSFSYVELADRAAIRLREFKNPTRYAVTCDPDGIVMVEPYGDAVLDDVVGVYDPDTIDGKGGLPTIRLARQIAADLRHHREAANA